MLSRVLEPEVMDSSGEAFDYDSMDHSAVNRVFVDDLLKFVPNPKHALDEVLDLGTGTALIPIELCRRLPEVCVVAVDLAASMLDLARANLVLAGLLERVTLEQVDAKGLPYRDGEFSAVISNSIVHHVPEPRTIFAEAIRVTQPGGYLFIRDLLRPGSDAEVTDLVDRYAAGATSRQRELFDASLRAALSLDEVRSLVAEFGFLAQEVQQTSDRHWTFAARQPV